MKSIQKMVSQELVINKSRFINVTYPITTVEQALSLLSDVKKEYPDANHHCYAYILHDNQDIQKFSDDGEPSKTAGMPMLDVLKKNGLTDILTVTIRYFGGIKLGAGGLVRAYTKSVSESIKLMRFSEKVTKSKVEITIPFDLIGKVEKYLRENVQLDDTTYDTSVHYHVTMYQKEQSHIEGYLQEVTSGVALFEIMDTFTEYE